MSTTADMHSILVDLAVYKTLENSRTSFKESHNDILRRMLLMKECPSEPAPTHTAPSALDLSSGRFGFVLKGEELRFKSLKEMYRSFLFKLAKENPGFLDQLSREEYPGRRIVARDPAALFKKTPSLTREFAEELVDGWFYDTNLSQQQVESRIARALKCANITMYGDFIPIFP